MDSRERTVTSDTLTDEIRGIEHDARPADSADSCYVARRLTPAECARLQGFPDDWAADVPHTDSAEYKMWGNGIALPCLLPMFHSLNDVYRREMKP